MRLSTPRIPPLAESEWNDDVKALLEPLRPMGEGRVFNIFATLARHPDLMKRWLSFGSHVLIQSTFPPRERELAILRVGWLSRAEYEWAQHVVLARRAGIDDAEIERVIEGPDAAGWSAADAAVLRAVDELHGDAFISDGTWKQLAGQWEVPQLIDLIFTVGQYMLVSMALNSLGVQLDPGYAGFPSGKDAASSPSG